MAQSTSRRSCLVEGIRPRVMYDGKVERSYIPGEEYAAFLDIPYAARPDKKKPYQAPEALPSDEPHPGQPLPTYDAKKKGKISTQLKAPDFKGSSDCLYLNIFLPRHPKDIHTPLPVLVFIHGGGFATGSNDPELYTPDFIVRHELVFVTINYRLGIFGFMNKQSEDCPGNAGLKDQVKALEWIRDNIINFKGDPENVTLSGWSAGATCVNMHLIADKSKDLFHKAIIQSGGIYCPWGYRGRQSEQNQMLSDDSKFDKLFRAKKESKALQKRAHELLSSDRLKRHPKSFSPFFGPTQEKYTEEGFITEDIDKVMKKVDHKKPVMAGITMAEGIIQFATDDPLEMFSDFIPDAQFRQVLMDNFRWSARTAGKCFGEIRKKYFPHYHSMPAEQRRTCLAHFLRDLQFRRFYDNLKFGPDKTLHDRLYVYRFDHVSKISAVRRFRTLANFHDATHGDELNYLYTKRSLAEGIQKEPDPELEAVINHMCTLWANFCKYGAPSSTASDTVWRNHTEEEPCFLSIGKELKLIDAPLFKEEWDWLNTRVNPQPTVDSPEV